MADEIVVLDLGGDNKGSRKDENVFDIESPVAIVTLVRHNARRPKVRGTDTVSAGLGDAVGKAASALADLGLGRVQVAWYTAASVLARRVRALFRRHRLGSRILPLIDLLPWQQPGCKFDRTWPIAPSAQLLEPRWKRFVERTRTDLIARLLRYAVSGRNIATTSRSGFPAIVDAVEAHDVQPLVRYGYRSFDRQWAFHDPRVGRDLNAHLFGRRSARSSSLPDDSVTTVPAGRGQQLVRLRTFPI